MSASLTAVVVVTHGRAGADMIDAAQSFLHMDLPLVTAVGVEPGDGPNAVDEKINQAVASMGITSWQDVLFLVDLVGSTPARICCRKCNESGHVVTGVNMPMLVKLGTLDRTRSATSLVNDLVTTATRSIHIE